MGLELGLGESYYLAILLFQVSLAALILASGRLDRIKAGFSAVLGLSALQAAIFLFTPEGRTGLLQAGVNLTDTVLLLTLAYLISQFPTPIGGERGARWTTWAWPAVTGSWLALATGMLLWGSYGTPLYEVPKALLHEGAFTLIAGLFALRLVPRWQELGAGPLKHQTLLAGAGLVVSTLFQVGMRGTALVFEGRFDLSAGPMAGVQDGLWATTTWLCLAGLVRLAVHASRSGDRETWLFTGLVVIGLVLGVDALYSSTTDLEYAAQVLRPLLLAGAILRYDLFRVPDRFRQMTTPAALLSFAVLVFLLIVGMTNPGGLTTTQVAAPAALLGVAAVATGAYLARRSLVELLSPQAGWGPHPELERYRLALERADALAGPDGDGLTELRGELGISQQEHRVLLTLLDQPAVVPTAAIQGAREGGTVAGRYEIVRQLGQGGFGRVLLARDLTEDRLVVLKETIRPWEQAAQERLEALKREAEVGSLVDSRHVAQVEGLVQDGYHTYLIREHVSGRSLEEVLEAQGTLPPRRVADLAIQLTRGIQALHENGLLHLDLKPSNVVIDDTGRAVIVDLGTVRSNDQTTAGSPTETRAQRPVGTLRWMAPEQILSDRVDQRTDLFQLGALIHRMLTGRHHLDCGSSAFEVEEALVRGEPPRDGPEGWQPILAKLLARDPDDRYPDAAAVLTELSTGRLPASVVLAEDQETHPDA